MSFSKIFVDRPIATSLVMAAIFLAGLLAFTQLPIAPLPRVDFPTIDVTASLPGADPETMASSVATPLERQFAQISDLTQITSLSTLGQTEITLQFDLDRNADAAAQDVSAAINAAGMRVGVCLSADRGWVSVRTGVWGSGNGCSDDGGIRPGWNGGV